jgi:hypothetical protein
MQMQMQMQLHSRLSASMYHAPLPPAPTLFSDRHVAAALLGGLAAHEYYPLSRLPPLWASSHPLVANHLTTNLLLSLARPLAPPALSAAGQPAARRDRPAILLYKPQDNSSLSHYQILARKQIEVFEASEQDLKTSAQGRVRRIVLGQVGIRCRHCSALPAKERKRGAFYFPSRLDGVYQTAQNMAKHHLADRCLHMPPEIQQELAKGIDIKSNNGCGKKYWATSVRSLGVYEDQECLRFI